MLTFTSAPLERDIEIAGSGKLLLHLATSGTDTDVIVKLSEQFPQTADDRTAGKNPRYAVVTKGWLRASHSFERHPLLDSEDRPDKVGRDTIHHSATHPSRLILPVLDAS